MEATKNLAKSCAIFQVFFLLYFSVKRLECADGPSRFYKIKFAIFLLIISTQIISTFYFLSNAITTRIDSKSALNYIIQILLFTVVILTYFFAFFHSFTTTKKMKKIFSNFLSISQICCQNFQYNVDCRLIMIWLYKTIAYIYFVYSILQIILYLFEKHFDVKNPLKIAFLRSTPAFIFCLVMIKFVFIVNLVNYYLEHLIIILNDLFRSNHEPNIINVRPKFDFSLERKLKIIRKIYCLIQENVELINHCMGVTILLQICIMILSLTSDCYRLFLAIVGGYSADKCFCEKLIKKMSNFLPINIIIIAAIFYVISTSIFMLFFIVRPCEKEQHIVNIFKPNDTH